MEKNNIEQLHPELPWKPRGSTGVQLQPWDDGAGVDWDGSASLGTGQRPAKGRGSSQPSAGVLGGCCLLLGAEGPELGVKFKCGRSWGLPLLPGALTILVTILSFSQPLMSSFTRLTGCCSLFTIAITQKSQDFILSLNEGLSFAKSP